ncbi:MAG: response regulator [Arcobacteraceae bacterium]|nr:response regulator [Arcobacteraceae bacterium]
MGTIQELQNYTKELTVLYVEDSAALLKQVGNFLKRIFKNVYLAEDGLKGLESYKMYKPDIVITDLTMPQMSGQEMIKNLKKINPEVKIIIISAHTDAQNLLEAIRIGVSDFIPKPIDNKLFQNALFKVANELTANEAVDIEKLKGESDLVKKLDLLSKSNTPIEFVNQYRGVPIVHHGYIINTNKTAITVHAPYIQTLAIKYQGCTTIESELIDTAIKAQLSEIDPNNREILLTNFEQLPFSSKKRKQLRVEPDDELIAVIHIKDKKIDTVVNDISINSISVTINIKDLNIKEADELDLTFGIKFYNENQLSKIEKNEIIYAKGKVFKVEINNSGGVDAVILFELNKVGVNLLKRYIHIREIELIEEFKQLKERYVI